MAGLVTALSSVVLLVALLLTAVPSLRFWEVHHNSEEVAHIQSLAAAQKYRATVVLDDPLLVYLDDFLSLAEVDEILNITSPLFVPSQVYSPDPKAPPSRTSSSCILPEHSLLNQVVAARAFQFLSNISKNASEPLSYYGLEGIQLVKYAPNQYYHYHMDWFEALRRDNLPGKGERGHGRGQLYNRVASFFLYLQDDCEGGETEFPDLSLFVETDFWKERIAFPSSDRVEKPSGIAFKPRKGSGVFWVNLLPAGFGDERVRHAGLPIKQGQKVGMNIWVKRDFGW